MAPLEGFVSQSLAREPLVAAVPVIHRLAAEPGIRYLAITDNDAYSVVSMIAAEDRRQAPLVDNCFRAAAILDLDAGFARRP
ncbi:hypothetical protein GCM10022237_43820 [Nocardioides ginsengisoli]|uniref:Uncharacterized protein n=1 Tax=Nocardioides ginsengisoli TaxID=363868 RepID=A0ABW3VXC5_9ACTN